MDTVLAKQYPWCNELLYLAQGAGSRTPCAILFEFTAKIGYEVHLSHSAYLNLQTGEKLHKVLLGIFKPGLSGGPFVTHTGVAAKKKLAKQIAAMEHIEHMLRTMPQSLCLLLNMQEREKVRERA